MFQRTLHLEHRYRPRRSLRLAIGHHAPSIKHPPSSVRHPPSGDEHTHHHSSKPVCIGERAHCPPCIIIIVRCHHHHRAVIRYRPSSVFHQASSIIQRLFSDTAPHTQSTSASIPTPRFRTRANINRSCQYQWVLGWLSSLVSFPCYALLFSNKGGCHRQ